MAAVINRDKLCFLILFSLVLLSKCNGNDILGCGGFVKSHDSLDFSKIEIGLYTKGGILKEKTECAPTNGYYFLPIYEKGDYVLKVHPPAGWSFEPSTVEVSVDGTSDYCSAGQDINFVFNGFGITGKVITAGKTQGPRGITVELVDETGGSRKTVTTTGGDFHFTPVIPGKYSLKASHSKWKLSPAQATVEVKEGNTALPLGVLAVKGYDVRGSVISSGKPIAGLHVLLYSKEENPKLRVEGCTTALLQGIPDSPICYSVTDAAGEFSFGLVPAGDYKLLALAKQPGQATVSYNVKPDSLQFTVQHDSQYIKNAFEVTGFTVRGAITKTAGGPGVAGARVTLDGRAVGTTDNDGGYTLPALQPGTYTVGFAHEQCEFEDVKLTITAAGAVTLNNAFVARWKVCGAVTPSDPRDVTLTAERSSLVKTVTITRDSQGKWCTFLPVGQYTARVEVSEREQGEGLQFYPLTRPVTVAHGPVTDITFSQLKAQLSGKVVCNAPQCKGLKVTLRSENGHTRTADVVDGAYTFSDVLPGSVELTVPDTALCWAGAAHTVSVAGAHEAAPAFTQTGLPVRVRASHEAMLEYASASGTDRGTVSIQAGENRLCVATPETYTLTPRGCHKWAPSTVQAKPGSDMTLSLVAVAHSVELKVISPEKVTDLTLRVEGRDTATVAPPAAQEAGQFVYTHVLFMAEGETATVTPSSSSLLFSPAGARQVSGTSRCVPDALVLRARRGVTRRGRLVPAVEGATVTLTGEDLTLTQVTGPDGTYTFGPLDASLHYTVTAEKESYVMGEALDNGDIPAHRLAEIVLTLTDEETGAPLQGALVSVSGGSYRRNQLSGADGALSFSSLAPGEYYVKPLMKEYKFSPPHTLLSVASGATQKRNLSGARVAWSASGALRGLGGAGWAGAAVEARSTQHAELAETSAGGNFRIRGLLPNVEYQLQLKESSNPELAGLKLATQPPTILIKENKDIEGINLIAIQPNQITDANVLIYTPNIDHYKTLRLKLTLEDSPKAPLYYTKLDPAGYNANLNPGLMYVLPRLPADNKTYKMVLESTLSKASHSYDIEPVYFNSDGRFKSFTLEFLPKVKTSEQELRQTSLLVVPFIALVTLAFLYRQSLLDLAIRLAAGVASPNVTRPRAQERDRSEILDKASIQHILNTVNPPSGKRRAVRDN